MSKVFTPQELARYDGQQKEQIYFAVRGKVYDFTDGKDFYGPGGSYHLFAGKETSFALATMSLKPEDVHGNISGLDEKQLKTLDDWQSKFDGKYPFIGRLEG